MYFCDISYSYDFGHSLVGFKIIYLVTYFQCELAFIDFLSYTIAVLPHRQESHPVQLSSDIYCAYSFLIYILYNFFIASHPTNQYCAIR